MSSKIEKQKVEQKVASCTNNSIVISAKNRDTSNDVLYAKGGASQRMTNPGNLYFYQLCEENYDEYKSTKPPTSTGPNEDSDKRVAIYTKIVDAVLATGGVFHKQDGSTLSKKEAIAKTRDRLRQIGLPKIRPVGIGEHDVVSVRGAAVQLYPGIKNWHLLIDGYVLSYFAELVDKNGVS